MNHPGVIEEVQHRAGLETWQQSERLLTQVLHAMRPLLHSDERRSFAVRLPLPLGEILRAPAPSHVDDDVDQFFARVAHGAHERLGMAVEHARIVCSVLGSRLEPDLRVRLMRDLPPAVAALFGLDAQTQATPEFVARTSISQRPPPPSHTLATGRPGSLHPVSESRADRTQSHSVAAEPNPHGDTKLSGAVGLTQEQLGETLATGKPAI